VKTVGISFIFQLYSIEFNRLIKIPKMGDLCTTFANEISLLTATIWRPISLFWNEKRNAQYFKI